MLKPKLNLVENSSTGLTKNSQGASSSTSASTSPATALGTHGIFAPASSSTTLLSTLADTANQVMLEPGAYSIGNKGGTVTTVAHGTNARAVAANNTQEDSVTTAHTTSAEVATRALGDSAKKVTSISISNNLQLQSSSSSTNQPSPIAVATGNQISPGGSFTVVAVSGNATFNMSGAVASSSSSTTHAPTNSKHSIREALNIFYQQQSQISYLFYDVPAIPISQAPRLAIVLEREQKDKEAEPGQHAGASSHSDDDRDNDSKPKNERHIIQDKRLNSFEDIYGSKKPVELPTLFEKQDDKDKASHQILILGRAGIGKTTLCQFIAYQWSKGKLWTEKYDWVFWIPLRNLSKKHYANNDKITLAEVVHHECCSSQNEDDDSTITLADSQALLKTKENKARILLLLDGYDEITNLDKDDTAIGNLIQQLLSWEHVVLTSRPYAIPESRHIQNYKRLENIGFLDEDISDYVKKFFTAINHPNRADECLKFLKQNPLVWGTAHIPITLELICSAWNERTSQGKTLETQLSMTELYEELVYKLGKRYLQKRSQNPIDTKALAKLSPEDTVEKCKPVMAFLGELAFETSKRSDNRILIDKTVLASLRKNHEKNNSTLFDDLLESHFLKSTGNQKNISDADFYFVHLTFQEFFAAYHIVKRLKQNDPDIIQFIKEHKHVQSWEVTWWFVAGLLKDNSDCLENFFDILEAEPRDLIGFYHQMLLLRCLDECQLKVTDMRKNRFIDNLSLWLSMKTHGGKEISIAYIQTISRYLGLSPRVWNQSMLIDRLLSPLVAAHKAQSAKDNKWDKNDNRLDTLEKIDQLISHNVIPEKELLTLMGLEGDSNNYVSISVGKILESQNSLSTIILKKLIGLLKEECSQRVIGEVLAHQRFLPEDILSELIRFSNEKKTRWPTQDILLRQTSLPEGVLKDLVSLLKDKNNDIADMSVLVLREQMSLPECILSILVGLLKDGEVDVRNYAALAIEKQSSLPELTLSTLVTLLKDEAKSIRPTAAATLRDQKRLPESIVNILKGFLTDKNDNVRSAAVTALSKQTSLQVPTLTALVTLLKDETKPIRDATVWTLRDQVLLPETIANILEGFLTDKNHYVRYGTAVVLEKQSSLPVSTLRALVNLLKDDYKWITDSAIKTLQKQSELSPEIFNAVVELLKDENENVRDAAVEALGTQTALTSGVITILECLLSDKTAAVRERAAETLGQQTVLPESILNRLVDLLKDQVAYVRNSAALALGKRAVLPQSILDKLMSLVNDNVKDVIVLASAERQYLQGSLSYENFLSILNRHRENTNSRASLVLESQKYLPCDILIQLVNLLKSESTYVRTLVAEILMKQTSLDVIRALENLLKDKIPGLISIVVYLLGRDISLSTDSINTLMDLLKDGEGCNRYVAAEALGIQKTLPEAALKRLINLLKDEDRDVRRAAVEVLEQQTLLPMGAAIACVGLLKDEAADVRKTAAKVIKKQMPLSSETVNALAGLLNDSEINVRVIATKLLENQVSLPIEIINVLVSLLKDKDGDIQSAAAKALRKQTIAEIKVISPETVTNSLLFMLVIKSLIDKLPIYYSHTRKCIIIGNQTSVIQFVDREDLAKFREQFSRVFHEFTNNQFIQNVMLSSISPESNDDDNDTVATSSDNNIDHQQGFRIRR